VGGPGLTAFALARNAWHLNKAVEEWPDIRFIKIKEQAP